MISSCRNKSTQHHASIAMIRTTIRILSVFRNGFSVRKDGEASLDLFRDHEQSSVRNADGLEFLKNWFEICVHVYVLRQVLGP